MNPDEVLIVRFLAWLKADGRSPKTIAAYHADLELASSALTASGGAALLSATTPELMACLASPVVLQKRNGQARATSSVKRVQSTLRTFFSWSIQAGLRTDNPAKRLSLRAPKRKLPVFLSLGEKRLLLRTLRTRVTTVSFRDRVMIEVLLHTGIRLSELVNLNVGDVDLDNKHLRIRAKGGGEQIKFLKSSLRTLLKTYLKRQRPNVPGESAVFLSNWRRRISQRQVEARVKHWVTEAGIDKPISPHKLRHTFATHLLAQDGNLRLVQRALGHAAISTTAVYAHVVDDQLREAIEQME